MNAYHVNFNVEFDIPIKQEDFALNENSYEIIEKLITEAIQIQLFYFNKQGQPYHSVRAKNININHTVEKKDVQIL
jgi:hypothetical protein